MRRSTGREKTQRINAAYSLLVHGLSVAEAATSLARQFAMSNRQAYRYVEEAHLIAKPITVSEAHVAATFKLPPSLICSLKTRAAMEGMTISNLVSQALRSFLSGAGNHG
jgi:O-acetyl-ADP-ribose deacetylase (regulator of RNase III)